MRICQKCGKETDHKPLPIFKNGKITKHIIRCSKCIREGLTNVLTNLSKLSQPNKEKGERYDRP